MENTLELAPSAVLFLAFFGAFWCKGRADDGRVSVKWSSLCEANIKNSFVCLFFLKRGLIQVHVKKKEMKKVQKTQTYMTKFKTRADIYSSAYLCHYIISLLYIIIYIYILYFC